MATASYPQSVKLPSLTPAWVRLCIEMTQDLTLFIDHRTIVIDAIRAESYSAADVSHWIGLPLRSIVGAESAGKIDLLISNDVSEPSSDARWRHINLLGGDGSILPVLARYLVLKSDAEDVRMLVLRDLRPMQAANERFISAQRETEHQYNERVRQLENTIQVLQTRMIADASVEGVLEKIGDSPLSKVISETANSLERRCLLAILQEAGGSHEVAAKVAKMPLEAWMNKVRTHGLG